MPPPRLLTHDGRTQTLTAWAAECGLTRSALVQRLNRLGMTVADALTLPVQTHYRRRGGRPRADAPRPCPPLKPHKSGAAYCRWKASGRTHERRFGPWNSLVARKAYARFAVEWATSGADPVDPGGISVANLVRRWLAHAQVEYVKDGKQTGTYKSCVCACRGLVELYGDTLAVDFKPSDLRIVRQTWVNRGLARSTCNDYAASVARAFGWAVGQSLIPPAVVHALREVEPLKPGRTAAPDKPKRAAATDEQIAAALPHLSPDQERRKRLVAMVTLQRLTGMRPGEVCKLRPVDLDRTADVWKYVVHRGKNYHRGKPQAYYLGPKAVEVLRVILWQAGCDKQDAESPLFGITATGYSVAVKRACVLAGCSPWTPHQLRHAFATEVAKRFRSARTAASAIGDGLGVTTAVYLHVDPQEVTKIEVARAMG